VQSFVERAAKKAHMFITAGGKSPGGKGFFFEPTVIAGANQDDEIVRKEVFGPVVSVTRFNDVDQAVEWANDSDYGLSSSASALVRAWGSSRESIRRAAPPGSIQSQPSGRSSAWPPRDSGSTSFARV
jgi:acyl-CoA reductase-like NAD-dependent aldehyde dehydrogenase